MVKVLLIEDNLEIRENTAEILELRNFQVVTATNGREGLAKALEYLPNIILCDISMPEMTGTEVFQQVKISEATRNIPFVFVTASAEKKEVESALGAGADGYVCKPFETDDLIDTINRVLGRPNS